MASFRSTLEVLGWSLSLLETLFLLPLAVAFAFLELVDLARSWA